MDLIWLVPAEESNKFYLLKISESRLPQFSLFLLQKLLTSFIKVINLNKKSQEVGLLQIIVNGEAQEITSENYTVFQFLEDKTATLKATVVELNGKIIKQELWESTFLKAGDSLEILIFLGGG